MIGVCYGQDIFGKVSQIGAEYRLLPQGQGLYSNAACRAARHRP